MFDWPTRPSWLYRLTQGAARRAGPGADSGGTGQVLVGHSEVFSAWPPARSAGAGARADVVAGPGVGGILFEIVTGVLNIQYDYIFGFSFYTAHYFGAWVFIAGFVVHVAVKLPTMIRSLRSRSLRSVLRTSPRPTPSPEPRDATGLVAQRPGRDHEPARRSRAGRWRFAARYGAHRRGDPGGVTRRAALLLPRGRSYGKGPNDFQINRTAVAAGLTPPSPERMAAALHGGSDPVALSRAALLAMEHHTVDLPIACVEGWSTVQTWTGVRLPIWPPPPASPSLPRPVVSSGTLRRFDRASTAAQILDPDSLLAFQVNGADLRLDHGFPARIMMPAIPAVHNTKWVQSIDFRER